MHCRDRHCHSDLRPVRVVLWLHQRRHIYSNMLGYLGGINWAILVARVCQLYPTSTPSKLLFWFFVFYRQWKWPHPILLAPLRRRSELGLKVRTMGTGGVCVCWCWYPDDGVCVSCVCFVCVCRQR